MKKVKILLVGLFVLLITPICVSAKSYTFDGITYELDDTYKVTTKENMDTSDYRPLDYTEEEFKELLNSGEYSLFGLYDVQDRFSVNFKVKNVSECGNVASDKNDLDKCMSIAIDELKTRENTDIVRENTFTSQNGINYYTLKYFKLGGTYLEVTTSYNNISYTFAFATSYGMEDIEAGAQKIMDSVSLDNFKASVEEVENDLEKENDDVEEEKDYKSIIFIGITVLIVVIGGISIFIFKKR